MIHRDFGKDFRIKSFSVQNRILKVPNHNKYYIGNLPKYEPAKYH